MQKRDGYDDIIVNYTNQMARLQQMISERNAKIADLDHQILIKNMMITKKDKAIQISVKNYEQEKTKTTYIIRGNTMFIIILGIIYMKK